MASWKSSSKFLRLFPAVKSLKWNPLSIELRQNINTTAALAKNIRAGQPKISVRQNKPLTYEESQYPYLIGVTKSWNSWNTSTLYNEGRASETAVEDIFIRKFMTGTWPQMLVSEVIIKRRHNMIVIAALVLQRTLPRQMYFLKGYTEEMLSYILKCPIRLEIQTIKDKKDVIFKYI